MQVQLSLARLLWELLTGIIIDILFSPSHLIILTDLSFTLQLVTIINNITCSAFDQLNYNSALLI